MSSRSLSDENLAFPAPAKLNLMLRIIGRRSDGYHQLQTVFQFLDIHDQLRFKLRNDGRIVLHDNLSDLAQTDNLCYRAAQELQRLSGSRLGVEIRLQKQLPMGAGLGGGSSDAATTLMVLNQLWELSLSAPELMKIALGLGADVPIFIHGHAAWAEGIGEELTDIEIPENWYLLLQPACHVSTADIFSHPDLTRNSPRITIRAFLQGNCHNDCLPVVRRRHPDVAQALDWLNQYADARLTGTGACVFAAFADRQSAHDLLAKKPASLDGFVARGINRSPLKELLQPE
ncbi:MAG: 4-(cytidine 5'-diphospho)-2-C-methyl-D-erythritol kinase [gamma proteobacterium symbiont of Ctena orbiculata]|uniref:4-diphosphocytidyl-2-C-methyl-D-erythritol kinase n=1 Tax=Candidatus Thiodiazotropha taylori TaxID=2792791 RepID=A0A944QVA3_9GAMM|nr:4-(cytidine 5'-diphospho)-2-C-methyl-D-erythritol kinase [Candidatus Thiodiazotropha taylori]PUB90257.1 MAG: 4-(cytidine 5'-diphospho)-2-C-methyl-D-erythritol kinase [gamma proteobacterium symbiont of Ctena orbiculata]MBT2989794.1 4-(cytidine 5'-diphospho)-2-C-methyl-D-erythritol kinase [Candidatus Thiodiazotropha taylori]MBT2995492.1 4-(cytidine 5'-diphospho)-2-C-methyl-D-erythritol kinase [Candidatus Thiodiazotropha taylori]MBT3002956.1 4-(cytidine 5'-diphospho)-2-C-methyl-D-erythritol kin